MKSILKVAFKSPILLLICLNICAARWESAYEHLCDKKGCSYLVRLDDIVDKIPHHLFFDWEWNGFYSVYMDDDSNNFQYGHEICVDVNGCNGTFICAQIHEMTKLKEQVDLIVAGRVLVDNVPIYADDAMTFTFSGTENSITMPTDVENFLVELGY
ncbi:PREDICTED: uncharacterized protein LOC108972821 [Bactrocera latifrons]|uniref:uncharacterized protein LOC108972821 n=1 Tax=Bactrocera latifrons TaxID=174628 RepID=UPI0008DE668C|nr:PREDICTED: uncharacterized protein LOC108972821 [Bactrocera latifrons]